MTSVCVFKVSAELAAVATRLPPESEIRIRVLLGSNPVPTRSAVNCCPVIAVVGLTLVSISPTVTSSEFESTPAELFCAAKLKNPALFGDTGPAI